jgi:hypothetical protein
MAASNSSGEEIVWAETGDALLRTAAIRAAVTTFKKNLVFISFSVYLHRNTFFKVIHPNLNMVNSLF